MREYGMLTPGFWIGDTGKLLRGCPEAQVVATYLMSSPHANMLGLYYLPMPFLVHETGIPLEGALEGLRRCIEAGFCLYDEASEFIWVMNMARFQIGTDLKPTDNRCKGVQAEYDRLPQNPFLTAFYERYSGVFHMTSCRENSKGLGRGLEGAPKPGTGTGTGTVPSSLRSEECAELPAAPPAPLPLPEVGGGDLAEQLVDHWNTVCGAAGLPKVLKLDQARRARLKARLKDKAFEQLFREACDYIAHHPSAAWLRGQGERHWLCTLDYLLKPGRVEKHVEEARAAPRSRAAPTRAAAADASFKSQVEEIDWESRKLPTAAGAP